MDPKLTNDELEIYSALGLAHTKWAELEDMACAVFCEIISPRDTNPAGAAFWRIQSFEARLDMMDTAIQKRLSHTDFKESAVQLLKEWKKVNQRSRERNTSRNKLAHGSAVGIDGKLVYVPFYYAVIREKGHIFFPAGGVRVISSLPKNGLNKHNILSISRGFQLGTERLRRFFVALQAHNKAQHEQDEATRRFFADAEAQAARISANNLPPQGPSEG